MEKIIVDGLARLPSFSHAAIVGSTIYVSGTLGTETNTMELVPGGTGSQTRQTLENIRTILQACGADLEDVAKVNVYLADIATFPEMNEAYLAFWDQAPPARITVGGADLALGAAVEIDCIAEVPQG